MTGSDIRPPAQATVRPRSVAEVRALVLAARERRRSGQPAGLYPVSTGRNWGYGSAQASVAGCQAVDLSGMRRILNEDAISASNPVAILEPGVTQGQLHAFLEARHPDLTFNVTGSARETSILGNALDRGVGYLGPRRDDLFGLEFVTGTGEVLQTGFRRLGGDSPLAACHPFGLGPMLDGLMFQGNFGIVTSACFRLMHKPACSVGVSLALKRDSALPELIDALARLKREGVMGSVTHIGNKARSHASLMQGVCAYLERNAGLQGEALRAEGQRALDLVAPHEWTSLGGVSGTRAQVKAALAEIRARVGGIARVGVITDERLDRGHRLLHAFRWLPLARAGAAATAAVKPLHGLATGVPTDAAIDNLLWRFGSADLPAARFDESACGILFISPALPMDGAFVARFVEQMKQCAAGFGHTLYLTLNIETPTSMVAVSNLLYDRRDPAQADQAKRCADALYGLIRAEKLEVYRARADMMGAVVDATSPYWQAVASLKRAWDPDDVIAPGRYAPIATP